MDHHSVLRDKIEHLIEDEMQSLRDRIEELEELLGIGEEDTNLIRAAIPDITPTEAQIVGFLRRRRGVISKEAIYAAIWADSIAPGPTSATSKPEGVIQRQGDGFPLTEPHCLPAILAARAAAIAAQ